MDDQLTALERIYHFFQTHTGFLSLACSTGCSTCCTRNVVMTTLEGRYLLESLPEKSHERLLFQIRSRSDQNRFIPKITTNRLAELCLEKKEVEEPENDPNWGKCPLLENGRCTVYGARPFMCRAMISHTSCSVNGYASIDPYVITLGTVCLQYIEQIDSNGLSGNLTDILLYLSESKDGSFASETHFQKHSHDTLIPNRPIHILMVPPEHRGRIESAIRELHDRLGGRKDDSG
ncbi:MAG: hypothetical protein V1714_02155 [Pseudomonadota bacterium]